METHKDESHWDAVRIFAPAVLIALIALIVAYQFVDPAPPKQITIATGQVGSAYHAYGEQYRDILARDGVELEVRVTAGSVENIELLETPESDVDLAFVQGGVRPREQTNHLVSLASLYYEPVWGFLQAGVELVRPADLVGKRVSLGLEGSGTRVLLLQLLADSGIRESDLVVSSLADGEALDGLEAGTLDVAFMIASAESSYVRRGFETEGLGMAAVERAEAYTRLHKYLSRLTLPQGVIDLRADLPPRDIELIAPTATLVSRKDLHPALVDLLLEVADEVHRDGGLFERPGEFPSPEHLDFPLSKDARRFFESGPPFLRRTLPFWAATLIDRMKIMLVPLIALIIPLMRFMPGLYRWRMRSRVFRWYKELRLLERGIDKENPAQRVREIMAEIDHIEKDVRNVSIPWSYAEDLYHLRLHIQYIRERVQASAATKPEGS